MKGNKAICGEVFDHHFENFSFKFRASSDDSQIYKIRKLVLH